ncbi:MAG: hypothetical protein QW567_03645 [Candidatus Hadarchaeales archaeon]
MISENNGSSSFPLIVLYGVVLAMLLFALFMTVYERQIEIRVQEEAKSLAEELGRTAFLALSGGQPFKDLPPDVGGSLYAVEVRESVFSVKIVGGRGANREYTSVVNAEVYVENGEFQPGGRVYFYFMRENELLVVSSSPIEPSWLEIGVVPTGQPPTFYYFSKENPMAAAGIMASYFTLSEQGYLITGYSVSGSTVIVRLEGTSTRYCSVSGYDDDQRVGNVEGAWVVSGVGFLESATISSQLSENLDNAVATGWLFSPSKALRDLRLRTWMVENQLVTVPSSPQITAACVTTNTGRSYPVWRITWENYVVYYRAIPWLENDADPGFVMQSSPFLEPVL